MTYVIAEPCAATQDSSCAEVCPVDCIHPTPDDPDYGQTDLVYIDPDECIDCAACITACPVNAIFAERDLPPEWAGYAALNARYYAEAAR
jgi:ferredoxin